MEAFPASRKFVADWVEDCRYQSAAEWKLMMETVARIYPDFEVVSILLDKVTDALDREEMVRIALSPHPYQAANFFVFLLDCGRNQASVRTSPGHLRQ